MSRRDGVDEQRLAELIDSYKCGKDVENAAKKKNDQEGKEIKTLMSVLPRIEDDKGNEKCSFSTPQWTATVTYTQNSSLNEQRTIDYLKENLDEDELKKVVKTKEYVDEDYLEKLVYNGAITTADLVGCIDVGSKKATLRISKNKEGK